MIRRFSIQHTDASERLDVEVDAPSTTVLNDVLVALRTVDAPWYNGADLLDLDGPFTQVRNGAILTGHRVDHEVPRGMELSITAGPSGGRSYALADGTFVIGRDTSAQWRLEDPSISRRHARVDVLDSGVLLTDLGSSNGSALNGTSLHPDHPVALTVGDVIELGDCILQLRISDAPNGQVRLQPDGQRQFNIQPRERQVFQPVALEMSARPDEVDDFSSNVALGSAVTTAFGTVLAAVLTHRLEFLFIALLAPIQYLFVNALQRRRRRATHDRSSSDRQELLERRTAEIAAADNLEVRASRQSFPTIGEVIDICAGPTSRLWERLPTDPDFAAVRVGASDRAGASSLREGTTTVQRAALPMQPIVVSFQEHGVTGLAGPHSEVTSIARWIVAQVAALHGPQRLGLMVLCGSTPEAQAAWTWVQWLPHVWDGQQARIGADLATTQALLASAVELIDETIADLTHRSMGMPAPRLVVVIDDVSRLAGEPLLDRLLTDGPLVGVVTVCIDATRQRLRSECTAVVEIGGEGQPTVSWATVNAYGRPVWEGLDVHTAELIARSLSDLEPAHGQRGNALLPYPLTLDDVNPLPTAQRLAAAWERTPSGTAFTFGATEHGPMTLDLRDDGPHILVVGTTGAGKSETIQAILASMATANRPDQLNFALFDFKGGACYGAALHLPHSTTKVVNLDGADGFRRALQSIRAELVWRQRRFTEVAPPASSLDEYEARRTSNQVTIPRLVVVIDEYGRFVTETKGASENVTQIAQIGRSLGVHLLLGTQTPRGVIDNAIKANVQTKICLRTADSTESSLVVDSPLPSKIAGQYRGRGYALTPSGRLVAFQGAWAGAPSGRSSPSIAVRHLEFRHLAHQAPAPKKTDGAVPAQQLDLLCDVIGAAWRLSAPSAPLRTQILPALGTDVELGDLRQDGRLLTVGVEDRLAQQDQPAMTIDPASGRHVLVLGSSGTGRTNAIRAIALAAGSTTWPTHVHIIDLGSRRLAPLEQLAHVGVVATEADPFRVGQLVGELVDLMQARDVQLSREGVDRLDQLGTRPPAVLLLVDNWSGLVKHCEGDRQTGAGIQQLLARGQSAGITVVAAGDHEFDQTLSRSFGEKLILHFNDDNPYIRHGVDPAKVPEGRVQGRAIRVSTGNVVQFALADVDSVVGVAASPAAQDALRADPPLTIRELPDEVGLSTLTAALGRAMKPFEVIIGASGPFGMPLTVNLDTDGPAMLVTGPPRSGRSVLVESIATQLREAGVLLAFVGGRRSPLLGRTDLWRWTLTAPLGGQAELISEILAADQPVCLVLDDVLVSALDDAGMSPFLRPGRAAVVANASWAEARSMSARSPFGTALREVPTIAYLRPERDTALREFQVVVPSNIRIAGFPGRGLMFRHGESHAFQAARVGGM